MEKNTVLLDLEEYDRFKKIEDKYYSLKKDLDNCITRYDKKGNQVENGFYMVNPTVKIKIDFHELCKVLDIQDYEIELIK